MNNDYNIIVICSYGVIIIILILSPSDILDVYFRKTVGGMKLKMQPSDYFDVISSINTFLKHGGMHFSP